MAKVFIVFVLFSSFQINTVSCEMLTTKNAVLVNRGSDTDIFGMSSILHRNTQETTRHQHGGLLTTDTEKQSKDSSLQKLQYLTRNTKVLNIGMDNYPTVQPKVVKEKDRKQSENISSIVKTATLTSMARTEKPNLVITKHQYENKQANEINETYSTVLPYNEIRKINESSYSLKHVMSQTRNQNQSTVNGLYSKYEYLQPSSQVPFKWERLYRSTMDKYVNTIQVKRNNSFQKKENTIKSSEENVRHLISAITSQAITGFSQTVQNDMDATTALTFTEAQNELSTRNMYDQEQTAGLRNQNPHITDKFGNLTYDSPKGNELLREDQHHHENATHELPNTIMKTVTNGHAGDLMKFSSSSYFKNTHNLSEKINVKQDFKDLCSRLDLQFCNSFSYAAFTLWVLVIGGIVVFLFIFTKRRCSRYIRGNYRPVPHEYDFELNPKYKNY